MSTDRDSTLKLCRQLFEQFQVPLRFRSSRERLVGSMSISNTWSEDMCAGPTRQRLCSSESGEGRTL
jgi:hypothetical protein